MEHDPTFRVLLILGMVIVLPIAVYHRVRSQTSERLERRQEGWLILLTLRPAGIAAMGGTLAFMLNPSWMRWSAISLPAGARWSGIAFGCLGGALVIWTLRTLGPNLTDTVVTRRDHTLVTQGPYRWVRHPFYICAFLMMLANGLATANGFILAASAVAVALLVLRTPIEERKLTERFGNSYRQYMDQTGRFLPKWR